MVSRKVAFHRKIYDIHRPPHGKIRMTSDTPHPTQTCAKSLHEPYFIRCANIRRLPSVNYTRLSDAVPRVFRSSVSCCHESSCSCHEPYFIRCANIRRLPSVNYTHISDAVPRVFRSSVSCCHESSCLCHELCFIVCANIPRLPSENYTRFSDTVHLI